MIKSICQQCNKEFLTYKSTKAKFCSSTCYHLSHRGQIRVSLKGKYNPFYGKKHTEKTKKQMRLNHKDVSGENNPMYGIHRYGKDSAHFKNYTTELGALIRMSEEYKKWRLSVFKHDNYRCQECFTNRNIEAHHIDAFRKLLKEFISFYNQFSLAEDKETLRRLATTWQPFWSAKGQTLCKTCHDKYNTRPSEKT